MAPDINLQTSQPKPVEKPASVRMSEVELQKLKKACADFESIFTYQMIKTMRQTVPKNQMGFGNFGKDTYTMMMDQKLAETIATKGDGMGLQKVLYDQLTQKYKQNMPKEGINKLK